MDTKAMPDLMEKILSLVRTALLKVLVPLLDIPICSMGYRMELPERTE
jgi:hypothetical protein